jgi:hypothetical protein
MEFLAEADRCASAVFLRKVDRRSGIDQRNISGAGGGLFVTDLVHALGRHFLVSNKKK